ARSATPRPARAAPWLGKPPRGTPEPGDERAPSRSGHYERGKRGGLEPKLSTVDCRLSTPLRRKTRRRDVARRVAHTDEQECALPFRVEADLVRFRRGVGEPILRLEPHPLLRVHAVFRFQDRRKGVVRL